MLLRGDEFTCFHDISISIKNSDWLKNQSGAAHSGQLIDEQVINNGHGYFRFHLECVCAALDSLGPMFRTQQIFDK